MFKEISKISLLSVLDQLSQTIYVDSNPAKIESVEVIKNSGNIIYNKSYKEYNLLSYKLKKSELSSNINLNFIEKLNSLSKINDNVKKIKILKKNILFKILSLFKDNTKILSDCICEYSKDSTWMIVSPFIFSMLKLNNKFISQINGNESSICKVGKLDSITIYLNSDAKDNSIYFGKYDDFNIIINRNIATTNLDIEIEYCFIPNSNNNTKRLIIE
jgi:hypothetical protein